MRCPDEICLNEMRCPDEMICLNEIRCSDEMICLNEVRCPDEIICLNEIRSPDETKCLNEVRCPLIAQMNCKSLTDRQTSQTMSSSYSIPRPSTVFIASCIRS